ncbi:HEAT repeat domain-containing protein [Kitasatospora sp. NPDC004531]
MNASDDNLLAGLDDIDWAALGHAYGSAEDVPALLRAACGADEKARDSAFRRLFGNIFHQGTRYSASPFAVPFLVRIAVAGPPDARIDALWLLTRLAVDWHDEYRLPLGIDTVAWRAAAPSHEETLRSFDEAIAAETDEGRLRHLHLGREHCAAGHPIDRREGALRSYDAVSSQLSSLIKLFGDRDPAIRTRTAYLFGWFPEEADVLLPPLLACLDAEADPVTATTLLVAIGLLADHDPADRLRRHLAADHPLLRWAAATALGRLLILRRGDAPDLPPTERVVAELAAFGARPAPEPSTEHNNGDLHSYALRTLLGLLESADDPDRVLGGITRALPHLRDSDIVPRPLPSAAAKILAAAFEPADAIVPFTDHTPARQELLRTLAELLTAEDFQEFPFGSDLHQSFTSHGLPGTRAALRAYAGLPTEGEDPDAPLPDPWARFRDS